MLLLALISQWSSSLVELGGKHPIEASALAILFGILLRNLKLVPQLCLPGIKASEKLLVLGIVLLGSSFNLSLISAQGSRALTVVLVSMSVSLVLIFLLGRLFKLGDVLSTLLAVGTTICGTSAIAITAPLIGSKEEETSYAVGTVALWGLVAVLLYPVLGQLVGATDLQFGLFAGTAIHSTPQVVGAGYMFSDAAGQLATAVKLLRNCFMAPLAMLVALWWSKRNPSGEKINWLRAFPWFLFGYFLMAGLSSYGFFSPYGLEQFQAAGKLLILLAMAGIGLNTSFEAFRKVGWVPLLVGGLGTLILGGFTLLLIRVII